MHTRYLSHLTLGLTAAALVACAGSDSTLGPTRFASVGTEPQDVVNLCKIGPAGTNATFSVSATGGSLPLGASVYFDLGSDKATPFDGDPTTLILCQDVWKSSGDEASITITESASSANTELYRVTTHAMGEWVVDDAPTGTVTVRANATTPARVWFKNRLLPPSTGTDGCTPGYWRQTQHYDSWAAPYTPSTAFNSVFANAFPGKTLAQVVRLGGGGLNALGRHTVAALLNAANPDVAYGATPAAIIAAFNAAYASGNFEEQKNIFEGWNERSCPLN